MVLWAVLGGFVLDALFGDPAWLPHPVVLMGRCISRLEILVISTTSTSSSALILA